ncbi:MAG: SRPBCC domain-containing protein [Bacteroidetes bacterium]|nr:SRPBCC domain-containing protein [Bacteroidota bacterium]
MNSKITVSATINASTDKVWNYYTRPEHIVHWNFADVSWHCPSAENDMHIGGTYKARMEAKDGSFGFDFEAVYTQITPGSEFTYEFGGRTAHVQLESQGDQTKITVAFDPENEHPLEMQQFGWQAILNHFKAYVEAN